MAAATVDPQLSNRTMPESEPLTPPKMADSPMSVPAQYVKIFDCAESTPEDDPSCPPRCPMVDEVCSRPFAEFCPPPAPSPPPVPAAPAPPSPPSSYSAIRPEELEIEEIVELDPGFESATTEVILPDEITDPDASHSHPLSPEPKSRGKDTGVDPALNIPPPEFLSPRETPQRELVDEFAGLSCTEGFCNISSEPRKSSPVLAKRNHRESLGNMSDMSDDELANDDENAVAGARRLRRRIFRSADMSSLLSPFEDSEPDSSESETGLPPANAGTGATGFRKRTFRTFSYTVEETPLGEAVAAAAAKSES